MPGSMPRQTSPLVVVGNGLVHLVSKLEVGKHVLNVVVAFKQVDQLDHLAGLVDVADRNSRFGNLDDFSIGDLVALLLKSFAHVHHGAGISRYLSALVLHGDIVGTGVDRVFHELVLIDLALNDDAALALKVPGNAAGRAHGAAVALKDRTDVINLFITAPLPNRIKRVAMRNGISEDEAKDRIRKQDKDRAAYYNFYSAKEWGDAKSYDLCIDSSLLGIEGTVELLEDVFKKKGLST